MDKEKIIKKEDGLTYKTGFGFWAETKGSLTLNPKELNFISDKEENFFSVSLDKIVNVRAVKGVGVGVDYLIITSLDGSKTKEAKFQHFAFWDSSIGNLARLKEPYFKSWEVAIDKIRLGEDEAKNENNFSDLERLAELKNKGVISEEEFTSKKKKILGL